MSKMQPQPDQTILIADKNGKHNGKYVSRNLAHTGRGRRHLAISVLLYNNKGQVLLQRRKHKIHNNIWELTGSTHQLHKKNGKDETSKEATYRCLKREYGISERIPLRIVGGVDYFASDGENCENEYDIILIGEYNGKLNANSEVSYKHKWVEMEKFLHDIDRNPKKYAPWVKQALPLLKKNKSAFLKNELEKFLDKFENYQTDFFKAKLRKSSKYGKLIESYYQNLGVFQTGGKKLRPFLVYLGYTIAGGRDLARLMPICLAVELFHSFLLIHDDIIDDSDLRRNNPTIHKLYSKKFGADYGASQAIVLGDIACFEAFRLIAESSFSSKIKDGVLKKMTEVLLETGYGEGLDVENSYTKATLGQVAKVTDLKTARYSFVGPLLLGFYTTGRDDKGFYKLLEEFGLALGFAFQLKDDILGLFGEEKVIGKSILSDIREGKNTLLIHKSLQLAGGKRKKELEKLWGKKDATQKDLERVRKIIEEIDVLGWAVEENGKMINKAKKNIPKITKEVKMRKILEELCDFVIERSY